MHSLRKTISFEFMEICLFEIHRPQLAVSGFIVTFSGTSPVEADIFCILFFISATQPLLGNFNSSTAVVRRRNESVNSTLCNNLDILPLYAHVHEFIGNCLGTLL